MKICVIGTGASGWMATNYLAKKHYVESVTVIGSSRIPSIGVGESTTGRFDDFLECIDSTAEDFIRESDAAVKYGVMYEDWSPRRYLHAFRSNIPFSRLGTDRNAYGRHLGKKPTDVWLHDIIDKETYRFCDQNHVSINAFNLAHRMRYQWEPMPNPPHEYENAWHFEANKFIAYQQRLAAKNPKVTQIDAKVVAADYQGEDIKAIVLEDGTRITADYFVVSTGETEFNERVFHAEYSSLGDVLLTDRALFFPKEYKDKRAEMHPYTIARTMPHGWRWITPTYSRIGTGYVFSSKHISDDQALEEFRKDVGDPKCEPHVVDFKPRTIKNPFRRNHAFLGMASGFLEPLDAPGLDLTANYLTQIGEYLDWNDQRRAESFPWINENARGHHQWFSAFILCQYKTSWRNDTAFWKDQKNVYCPWYEELMANLDDISRVRRSTQIMFYSTIAGKDLQWDVGNDIRDMPLVPVPEIPMPTLHHLDFLENMRAGITSPLYTNA